MFNKFIAGFVATMMFGAVASAQSAARPKLEIFAKGTAKRTEKTAEKRTEEQVREEMVNSLRKSKKFAEADLARISAGKYAEIKPETQDAMVRALQADKTFQFRVLGKKEGITNEDLARKYENSLETVNSARGKKTYEGKEVVSAQDVGRVKLIGEVLGEKVQADIVNSGAFSFGRNLEIAYRIAKRAQDLQKAASKRNATAEAKQAAASFKEKAGQLVQDQIVSYTLKGLEAEGALGEGTAKACAEMDKQAIMNFADFVRGGILEGKDVDTFVKGMARAASAKFEQNLADGITRICALATSPCNMLSKAIQDSCSRIQGAARARR